MILKVVVSSGIEHLTNPRDLFREVWRVLKPLGTCFVCFPSKPDYVKNLPVKMWATMNDEQKIWIVGRYSTVR